MQLKSTCPFTSGAITRSYNRLLHYKRALDRVGEIENEINQDFTNDGPFRVKRLAKEKFGDANVNNNPSPSITSTTRAGTGAFSFASPSLSPVFTFGAVSPIVPVAY